jgi:hypothetical protein
VPPIVGDTIGTSKVMISAFLGGEGLMCVDTLDPNEAFTQDHFVPFVFSDPKKHAPTLARRKHPVGLALHSDNLRCPNGQKFSGK